MFLSYLAKSILFERSGVFFFAPLIDDIIRLNKKEQQLKRRQATVNRRPFKKKGRLNQARGVSSMNGAVLRGVYVCALFLCCIFSFHPLYNVMLILC